MKITFISLFPSVIAEYFSTSMMRKATEINAVEFKYVDLRDYGIGPRKQVDDTPYGGGDGMVLKPQPLAAAINQVRTPDCEVILLSPQGAVFKQSIASELAQNKNDLVFVCGRYEGFDERVRSYIDMELSIGDYVLTGGEIPAMAVADAIVRLLPDVLGGEDSAVAESFTDQQLLEHPHYTRPEEFEGMKVPDVLLSGNHSKINAWRQQQRLKRTKSRRPDLLQ